MLDEFWGIPKSKKPTAAMTPADKKRLKELLYTDQNKKCNHCGRKVPADLMDLDRKRAGANGGGYTLRNTQLLCRTCNASKGSKSDSKARKTLASSITGKKPIKKPAKKKLPKNDDPFGWGFGF